MSLTGTQKEEAERKLREMAEEQNMEKQIKDKIKNISKNINDKLKQLLEADPKAVNSTLTNLNSDYLSKFLITLESKNQVLVQSEENLKNDRERLNREKMGFIDDKARYQNSIKDIKDTIVKIQKAIDDSVEQQKNKRNKIEEDLDKSIAEIKDKIKTFEKESEELQADNVAMREKKEGIMTKINGLEEDFKKKAQQKDESVKQEKEGLMEELKKVEDQVNEVTELNKTFSALQKKNFDNKLSIYLRTKKFPQLINSFENSASTIDKCKNELSKGVQRLNKAIEITKTAEAKSKTLNEEFIAKLKIQNEREEAIKKVKSEKEEIRARIIELQNIKKQKKEEAQGKKAE